MDPTFRCLVFPNFPHFCHKAKPEVFFAIPTTEGRLPVADLRLQSLEQELAELKDAARASDALDRLTQRSARNVASSFASHLVVEILNMFIKVFQTMAFGREPF